jgi:hypothetical protein
LQAAEVVVLMHEESEGVVLAVEGLALSAWLQGLIRSQLGQAAQVRRAAQIQFSLLLQALAADAAGECMILLPVDLAAGVDQVMYLHPVGPPEQAEKAIQAATAWAQALFPTL